MLLGMILSTTMETTRAKVAEGVLEGTMAPASGIRMFKGVPFAAPPVGDLRWREPQPAKPWQGVRPATEFAHRPMQLPLYSDMVWRSPGISEDCLYLNVWAPKGKKLPVLVYFYGGGFQAGASDEPRYDGESMARKGVVAITVNYRLGVFGFLAHPELTKESPHKASGNYGLLDQSAALRWVRKNAAAFGGDPKKITIAGESAGSFSVSAQMASPLSRGLIAGAIGESGAMFGTTLRAANLSDAEEGGKLFAAKAGASSLAELRSMPANSVLEVAKGSRFGIAIDGYFLPKTPVEIYGKGEQARVPLLAGWNSEESGAGSVLGPQPATPEGFARAVRALYPNHFEEALRAYPATTDAEARQAATDLASDRFIGYGTWKWTDLHGKTSGKPVFRYFYTRPRPGATGAAHSAEIEYALGNLERNKVFAWTDDDRKVSATMLDYFANFVKKGDPNGPGLPSWPAINREGGVMRLDVEPRVEPDRTAARYRFLESASSGR